MKTKLRFAMLLTSVLCLFSCGENHLIKDNAKREAVQKAFAEKKAMFENSDEIFSVFKENLTLQEREALEFIYAYAPLADMTFSKELYLGMVRTTLQARKDMPWAKSVPEDLFLHFVLPPRVNNEATLDSSREVFYAELKDRVKNLSLKDAALEVNHWCHEKVIYNPTDGRTSAPLATVKTAYGRCGEESVFTVAALRAVGIPARQVYTPRWAHCDDNHAWVEVWGGDKWYYLGACEPEPRLDIAWFTAPSMRGMLMHTKVFGDYKGPEEILGTNPSYTEINVTSNYAPTKQINITVTDEAGNPVPNATVEFKVYNYASFSTVATKTTDTNGKTFISLGLGDALVWASKENRFGYEKLSVPETDNLTVKLDKKQGDAYTLSYDIVPPVEKKPVIEVSEEEQAANAIRLAKEDSIRNAYIATFINDGQITELAEKIGADRETISGLLTESRGNHEQIAEFLSSTPKEEITSAIDLLNVISIKDLKDMSAAALKSHLNGALKYKGLYDNETFNKTLLNPRVSNEWVEPYRNLLKANLGEEMNIADIIELAGSIRINDELNAAVATMTPSAVLTLKTADAASRDVFFVSLARTYGIPARLEPVSGKPQYFNGKNWIDVDFSSAQEEISPKGTLSLTYKPIKAVSDPKAGAHFSVSKIGNDGRLHSVSMRGNQTYDMGPGSSFAKPFVLDTGNYMLTTGTRLASGAVLTNVTFFNIKEGQNTKLPLVLRENDEDIFVIGTINAEARVSTAEGMTDKSILDITGRGYFMLALIEANKEPTNHALRDMAKLKEQLGQWGRPIVMVFKTKDQYKAFDPSIFGELPPITYVTDAQGQVQKMFKEIKLNTDNMPVYVIADTFGRVVFSSEGYQINLGDHILNVISKI